MVLILYCHKLYYIEYNKDKGHEDGGVWVDGHFTTIGKIILNWVTSQEF